METFLSKEQKEAKQVSEINLLRYAQKSGDIKMITANKDSSIEIPEIAKDGYVFVVAVTKHINSDMKSITEVNNLIPIHANNFDRMVDQGGFALYDHVKIVHDPRSKVRDEYVFKIDQVTTAATSGGLNDGRANKSADMNAINESRKQIDAQKVTLENKASELSKKEGEITAKAAEVDGVKAQLDQRGVELGTREAELKKREEELAAREKALKGDGSQNQTK